MGPRVLPPSFPTAGNRHSKHKNRNKDIQNNLDHISTGRFSLDDAVRLFQCNHDSVSLPQSREFELGKECASDSLGPGALHSAGFRCESQTLSLNHLDSEQGAKTCI